MKKEAELTVVVPNTLSHTATQGITKKVTAHNNKHADTITNDKHRNSNSNTHTTTTHTTKKSKPTEPKLNV